MGIFSKWRQTGQTKTKSSVSQQVGAYCFDFDDVDIKLYVFCDAEAKCEVIGEVRGHAHVVAVKDKVMLTK